MAIHEFQLAEHGGMSGVRDQGLLEAALARPQHLFSYSPEATTHQLAAAYASGIARNHAFVDGNKRTAWIVCALFCELNGLEVLAAEAEVVRVMLALAANTLTEGELILWLEQPETTS